MNTFPAPQAVFAEFTALARIPHGSGNTAEISRYCVDFAKQLGLPVKADAAGNVVIRKPASKGMEHRPTVILQGHLDMVCAKEDSCTKDMEKDALSLHFDDTFLSADGTTLGGDDGIAVAYALALLKAQNIPHPPLTVLLTVDEEIGMLGAAALSADALQGDYLLNLDSEEEGILTVGCAGGVRVMLEIPVDSSVSCGTEIKLRLSGLVGGHSGMEIHRPHLNAIVTMKKLLNVNAPIRLCKFDGGIRDNVIPTSADAAFLCEPAEAEKIVSEIQQAFQKIKSEIPSESACQLEISIREHQESSALSVTDSRKLLRFLNELPNGVIRTNYHENGESSPITSLNLGVLHLDDSALTADFLVRSGINAEKNELAEKLHQIALDFGGRFSDSGDYPAWEYAPQTELEQVAVESCRRILGHEPLVQTIHAGLECGVLLAKSTNLQCISFGPDILDIHTPRERLSLASTERTWRLLLDILQNLGA